MGRASTQTMHATDVSAVWNSWKTRSATSKQRTARSGKSSRSSSDPGRVAARRRRGRTRMYRADNYIFFPLKKITTKKKIKKTKKPKERTGGIALAHADDRRRQ